MRTATDLAALWVGRDRSAEAEALLLVFEDFAEGRDMTDFEAAQVMLARLA